MSILFDIAILGIGGMNPLDRTGIYRYADNLFHHLIKQLGPDEFLPYADCALAHWAKAWLEEASFDNARLVTAGNPIIGGVSRLLHGPGCGQQSGESWRRCLAPWWINQSYLTRVNSPGARLFHSPFYPLPKTAPCIKRVLTLHDLIPLVSPESCPDTGVHRMRRTLDSLKPGDWIITVSQFTRQQVIETINWPEDRITVIHPGVSQSFRPLENKAQVESVLSRLNLPKAPYLLGVGTLEPRKNLIRLVDHFLKLVESHPQQMAEVHLVLAGEAMGKSRPLQTILAKHPDSQKRIHWTGFISETDLTALYAGALGFVFPSLHEGFGLPLLEAMACGIPVLSSNHSAMPEVVGDAGLLVDPGDTDAWCQAMLDLVTHDDLRDSLREKGQQRAGQFTWDKSARLTAETYKAVLS